MITTLELLERVKRATGKESVNALSKAIGCSRRGIDYWQKGTIMDDAYALRCADIAALDPGYVLYSIAAERAQKKGYKELFNFWKEKADQITPVLLSVSACFLLLFSDFGHLI